MATLQESMSSYYANYRNVVANNSFRNIDQYNNECQQMGNDWNLYFQSKAEGADTEALEAIGRIVDILGGTIDISTLPNVSGADTEADGVGSVSSGLQKITFATSLGTTDYRLIVQIRDSSGDLVAFTLGDQEEDGFYITPIYAGTLVYNAKLI